MPTDSLSKPATIDMEYSVRLDHQSRAAKYVIDQNLSTSADYLNRLMRKPPSPVASSSGTPQILDLSIRSRHEQMTGNAESEASWSGSIVDTQYSSRNGETKSGTARSTFLSDADLSNEVLLREEGMGASTAMIETEGSTPMDNTRSAETEEIEEFDSIKLASLSQMSELLDAHISSPTIAEQLTNRTTADVSACADPQSSADPDLRQSQFFSPHRNAKRQAAERLPQNQNQHFDAIDNISATSSDLRPEVSLRLPSFSYEACADARVQNDRLRLQRYQLSILLSRSRPSVLLLAFD